MYRVGRGGAVHEVDFDAEVRAGFAEGGVGGFGYDPGDNSVSLPFPKRAWDVYISGSVTPRST